MAFSLSLNNISKKYNQNWIFKSVGISISNSEKLVILGSNGSGKSTLLQIISGYVSQTDGTIEYLWNNKTVEKDNIYNHFSIAAPSIELIEEFTLIENANFFIQLKPLVNNMNADDIAQLCYLENSKDKPINQFSSGMKQRVKLALAITAQLLYYCLMNLPQILINKVLIGIKNWFWILQSIKQLLFAPTRLTTSFFSALNN